ncbi:MAG: hypothetical protein AABX38_03005 [Candidatus Micrarchaeota archaeon]
MNIKNAIFILSLFILLSGCTLVQKEASFKNAAISSEKNELLLNISFTGNLPPKELRTHLLVLDSNNEIVYDKDITVFEREFKSYFSGMVVEKYLVVNNPSTTYAKLDIFLTNQTITKEIGISPVSAVSATVEIIPQETLYSTQITLVDSRFNKISENLILELKINDSEDILYQKTKTVSKEDFQNGKAIIFIPYGEVSKSYYKNGSISVQVKTAKSTFDYNQVIQLRKYSKEEIVQFEEQMYQNSSKQLNESIFYYRFNFTLKRAGVYIQKGENRKKIARVDANLKNPMNIPQYLIRDDFYIRDSNNNFYPVLGPKSTAFGPLLKPFEDVNASFYFEVFNENDDYYFFYGDRQLTGVKKKTN